MDEEKAIALFEKASREQYLPAMFQLSRCYLYGKGCKVDQEKGYQLMCEVANQNDPVAQYEMFRLLKEGIGTCPDEWLALAYLEEAAKQGYDAAENELAYYYETQGQYEKMIEYYEKAALKGNSFAQTNLGLCYHEGKGVMMDPQKALYWYRKASEQGDAYADYYIANLYDLTLHDEKEAMKWYEKAAKAGVSEAIHDLAYTYAIHYDYEKAVYWYRKGVEIANPKSINNLAMFYSYGIYVEKDIAYAVELYQKAIALGNSDAYINLGELYYYGDGVKQDYEFAYRCYAAADSLGNRQVADRIGKCYEHGYGVARDLKKAFEYFLEGIDCDIPRAYFEVGRFYENGLYVKQDLNQALVYYQKAAQLKDSYACLRLAQMNQLDQPQLALVLIEQGLLDDFGNERIKKVLLNLKEELQSV